MRAACVFFDSPPHPDPLPRERGRGDRGAQAGERGSGGASGGEGISEARAFLAPSPLRGEGRGEGAVRAACVFFDSPLTLTLSPASGGEGISEARAFLAPYPLRGEGRGEGAVRAACVFFDSPPHPDPLPRKRGRGDPEAQAGERGSRRRGPFLLPLPSGERAGVRGQCEPRALFFDSPPHPDPLPRERGRGDPGAQAGERGSGGASGGEGIRGRERGRGDLGGPGRARLEQPSLAGCGPAAYPEPAGGALPHAPPAAAPVL
ncbi:MAG: hypothetical protein KatS3mg102_2864 [Planctomycetota bacterium]|nr:MAG: hypothetical protein KatS3mg102_2864 [Planctomycetota bacterium]